MLSVKYDMPEINIPSVIHNDKKSIARFMIRNYHQINSCLSVFFNRRMLCADAEIHKSVKCTQYSTYWSMGVVCLLVEIEPKGKKRSGSCKFNMPSITKRHLVDPIH